MTQALTAAPAVVRATSLGNSIQVEPLTCSIGAELGNVNLGAAAEDDSLMAEIRALILKHRVLFFRDQDITRAQHVAFARRFGELEDHPVVGSHPETGEKVLFVNGSFTTHFTNFNTPANVRFGLDKSPGASHLLNYLVSQACILEYQVRFRWKKNSIAFWDNRSTQRYAVMDYPPCHRKSERTAIIGDLPY